MNAPGAKVDLTYELIVASDQVSLTCGGEVMWTSQGDEDFAKEFDNGETFDTADDEQMDDVLGWLVDEGYIPPGLEVDVIEESDYHAPDI